MNDELLSTRQKVLYALTCGTGIAWGIGIVVVLAVLIYALDAKAVIPSTPSIDAFTESAIDNTDSLWYHLRGEYACFIWGTWDTATAGIETLVSGTTTTPTKLLDVAPAGLVGLTADMTAFVALRAGIGYYRLKVVNGNGSESLSLQCRLIPVG